MDSLHACHFLLDDSSRMLPFYHRRPVILLTSPANFDRLLERVIDYNVSVSFESGNVYLSSTVSLVDLGTSSFDQVWLGVTTKDPGVFTDLQVSVVPEPTTIAMLAGGIGMLLLLRRRKA